MNPGQLRPTLRTTIARMEHELTAEQDCFVFGIALDGRGGGAELTHAEVAAHNPLWLHLDYSRGNALAWMIRQGVDAQVAESLIRPDTRPRAFATGQGLLVVLRAVNLNPGAEPEDMVSLRMWIEADRLITVRQRRLLSIQDVRESLQDGHGPDSIGALVIGVIERMANRIADVIEQTDVRLTDFETLAMQPEAAESRQELMALRRQIATVRRFLAPQREALDILHRQAASLFGAEHAFALREQADRITRHVEDLDLLRERALVVQEELFNQIAQQQNTRMYVLSVVAAIFLPVTFVTGLFGMNVADLPGTDTPQAFWIVTGVMLLLGAGIAGAMRMRRWF